MSERRTSADPVTVAEIAAERFAYPTEDRPTWRTIIAGQEPAGEDLPAFAPADIAVIDTETNSVVLTAVVETSGDVTDYEALLRWLPASRIGPTFLYVPASVTGRVSELCHELGIQLAGLRGWAHSGDALVINQARLRPFALPMLVALLPPALRPDRFREGRAAQISAPTRNEAPPGHTFDLAVVFGVFLLITLVTELLLVFIANDLLFPTKGAHEADIVDEAFEVLTFMSAPVFALVVAVVLYSALRFRGPGPDDDGPNGDGPAFLGHGAPPWIWLSITTALTVAVIIFPGLTGLAELREDQEGDLTINVNAFRWAWDVEYDDFDIQLLSGRDELVLPVDQRVHFLITASPSDVLHSFWIPAFRTKIDAVPGVTTEIFVTPDRLGGPETESVYRVQCAEICGAGHTDMAMPVRVVEQAEFDEWVAAKQAQSGGGVTPIAATTVAAELVEWDVIPDSSEVEAGAVRFAATNTGTSTHEFVVIKTDLDASALPTAGALVDEAELDVRGRTALIDPAGSGDVTLDLDPGAYALICNIPGHYQLGMFESFTVTESTSPPAPAIDATAVATGLSEWDVTPDSETIATGPIEFVTTNTGTSVHELVVIRTDLPIDDLPTAGALVDESLVEVRGRVDLLDPGEAGSLVLDLEPGSYALVCNIPGHYSLGMRTTFTVTES